MKPLDFKSTLFAGLAGAFLFIVVAYLYGKYEAPPDCGCGDSSKAKLWGAAGFVVGAGVQTLVRLTGVS